MKYEIRYIVRGDWRTHTLAVVEQARPTLGDARQIVFRLAGTKHSLRSTYDVNVIAVVG